jgi:tubulin alpha
MIHSNQDGSSLFSKGHFTNGKEKIDDSLNSIRKLVEESELFQGFFINMSLAGGTGSGLGSRLFEEICCQYGKKPKMGFVHLPSENLISLPVEQINTLLSVYSLLEHSDACVLFDNESLYNICKQKLEIERINYQDLDKLVATMIS